MPMHVSGDLRSASRSTGASDLPNYALEGVSPCESGRMLVCPRRVSITGSAGSLAIRRPRRRGEGLAAAGLPLKTVGRTVAALTGADALS